MHRGHRGQRHYLPVNLFLTFIAILGVAGCNRHARVTSEQLHRDARASFERGELIDAASAADRGLQQSQDRDPAWAFRFRVLKAEVLAWQGKPKDALALLEMDPPASLADSDAAVRRWIVRGTADYLSQAFADATKSLSRAEDMANSGHRDLLVDVRMAQATLAMSQRDYASAQKLAEQVLERARQDQSRFLQVSALGTLGVIALRQGHYGESIDAGNAALPISRDLGNKSLTAKLLGNLGWCYLKLGDYEQASDSFEQAEKLSAQLGLVKDQFIWLTNIGSVHYEQRDYAAAADYYQRALVIARKLDNKAGASVCLNNLAATALDRQQYDAAEQFNREALELKRAIGDSSSALYSVLNEGRIAAGRKQYADAARLYQQVVSGAGDDASLRWEGQSELASLFEQQGNVAGADAQFRQALSTIDKARAALSREEYRLSFLGSAERFYNEYIEFLASRGRAREALLVAEHSRARTLAEGLGLPAPGNLAGFAPEQSARARNATILAYWLKPGHSWLWVVTPSRVTSFMLPAEEQIASAVDTYRKALMGPRDVKDSSNAAGLALYSALIEPAAKLVAPGARVVVVADRSLNTLNFETLLVPEPKVHYWIEDVAVSDASSIALLAGSGKRERTTPTLLLIGDPVYSGSEFPELKQAKLEVQDVSQHFASDRRTILAGAAATPGAYASSHADTFGYIHFVAHGTASHVSPLDSSIVLSPQGNDFRLYARDIMKQPLHAELVTISACYGAGTRSYAGEGLVGLSWAFLRAGAHNVIAALWEVSDTSTPQLMDAMYQRLQAGDDPATALRAAKLLMLQSDTVYRRPFYWGAFQFYSGS